MNVQEMMAEIPQLTVGERLKLIELLSVSVQREIPATEPTRLYRGASSDAVRGMLRPDNGHVPNDAEVKDIIAEYLAEKYA